MQELKYVGKTYSIHDAEEKAKGETEYASDIKLNNMLHAALVLSSVPHAKIKSMDFSKALCLEGVVSCFSCFNTTSKKYNSYRIWMTLAIQHLCPLIKNHKSIKLFLYY